MFVIIGGNIFTAYLSGKEKAGKTHCSRAKDSVLRSIKNPAECGTCRAFKKVEFSVLRSLSNEMQRPFLLFLRVTRLVTRLIT